EELSADNRVVTQNYFRSMGIQILRGRNFTEMDRDGASRVAIVNETFVRRFFPNEDPIGKRFNNGDEKEPEWWEIVGIVKDVKAFGLDTETHADIYRPFEQVTFPLLAFTIRTSSDPTSLAMASRNAIWAVDKDQ